MKNENLTREKFIENPFHPGKIYKTGDSGRLLEDVNILYFGKYDFQGKIRGNRVEPGEIEYWLVKYKEVKEAIVIAQGTGENCILTAYITAEKNTDTDDVRKYLQTNFSGYMIPSFFIILDKFPLNSSGKALIKIKPELKKEDHLYPENDCEKNIMSIWKKYLEIKNISITDNFFDAGWNSFLFIRVHGEIEKLYPGRVSVTDLFIHTSIRDIAEFILKEKEKPLIKPVTFDDKFFSINGKPEEFEFEVKEELFEKMLQTAHAKNMNITYLNIAAFEYLLYEISHLEQIMFPVIFKKDKFTTAIFNFNKILEPVQLLKISSEVFDFQRKTKSVSELSKTVINPESNEILPVLSINTRSSDWINTYDIYLESITEKDRIDFKLKFSSRIKNIMIEYMLKMFIRILYAISESSENKKRSLSEKADIS